MMMDTEEISKMVDNVYKNILDKFNPAARQLISAGKVYLKALHGAAAASRMYVEALSKLARHSQQQGSWGGCSDISAALLQVVDVYKEVHEQQMNILKAFYVDLLVPLETNLEKDTKVVQLEQKKFNAQHKQRSESHSKAAALSRKQRKKNKSSANDKDLKTLQRLEEEQSKLDAFREQSLRTALTQERRRYGFVLERQCSLAKHFLSMHTRGQALFQQRLPDWQAVARGREALPEELQRLFTTRLGPQSMWADDDGFCRREDGSMASALRKTRSMDASALDIRCLSDAPEDQHHRSAHDSSTLSRARSDLNLSSRAHSPTNDSASPVRPQSLAVSSAGRGWGSPLARALYAYLSSGENQLSFLEGDILALMGERNKGWQFGENLRTQTSGWFPLAYTELLIDDASMSPGARRHQDPLACEWRPPGSGGPGGGPHGPHGPQGGAGNHCEDLGHHAPRPPVAPPPVAPLPPPQLQSPRGPGGPGGPRGHPQLTGRGPPSGPPPLAPAPHTPTRTASGGPAPHGGPLGGLAGLGGALRPPAGSTGVTVGASLHSSNDSGFSNEPPAAPEIDYSDDEPSRGGDSTPRANGSPSDSPRGSPRGSPGSEERALSNVKGWLLYKSALDLWDDVEARRGQGGQDGQRRSSSRPPPPPPPRVPPPPRPSAAERADRDRSSSMTLPSSAKMRGRPLVPPPAPPPPPVPEANGHAVVKRTKSLLKFRRDTAAAADGSVLEGMALWRHRSLVDVRADEDGDGGAESGQVGDSPASSPKTVNGSLVKMKLVKIDIGEERQPEMNGHSNGHANGHSNGHVNGHANGHSNGYRRRRSDDDVEFVSVEEQTYSTLTKHGAAYFQKRVLERSKSSRLPSRSDEDDDEPPYEDAALVNGAPTAAATITDKKREAARRAAAEAVRAAALRRQFGSGDRLLTLPSRTRLAKSMSQELPASNEPAPVGSIFQYGKTLQSRLRAPDRGSRFDRLSITTGNLCGPWYDMWGADASVPARKT